MPGPASGTSPRRPGNPTGSAATAARCLQPMFQTNQVRGTGNYGCYSNPDVDRMIEQALSDDRPSKAHVAWHEVDVQVMKDVAIVPSAGPRADDSAPARRAGPQCDRHANHRPMVRPVQHLAGAGRMNGGRVHTYEPIVVAISSSVCGSAGTSTASWTAGSATRSCRQVAAEPAAVPDRAGAQRPRRLLAEVQDSGLDALPKGFLAAQLTALRAWPAPGRTRRSRSDRGAALLRSRDRHGRPGTLRATRTERSPSCCRARATCGPRSTPTPNATTFRRTGCGRCARAVSDAAARI